MDPKVRDRIPILNFLFMLDVLLYHIGVTDSALAVSSADAWCNDFLINAVGWMSTLCMAFFFATTGFLLFYHLDFRNFLGKARKRIMSLLVPYLLWQLIYLAKSFLQGKPWTLLEIVSKVFLFQMWPPVGALWYLYAVFLLMLLSPVFLLLFRKRKLGMVLSIILIVLDQSLQKQILPNFNYLPNILMHLPAYLMGAFLGMHYDEMSDHERIRYLLTWLFVGMFFNGAFPDFFQVMLIETMPIFLLWVLPVHESLKNLPVYKLSFLMLATHQSVISVVMDRTRAIVWRLVPSAALSTFSGEIIGLAACIAAAAGLAAVMRRFTPKTLRVLTGGRV